MQQEKNSSSHIQLHKLFTTAAFGAVALRQKWFILTQRDDALLISCLTESHRPAPVKVTSLQLISTWIESMKLAGFVFLTQPGVSPSPWYKSQICTENINIYNTSTSLPLLWACFWPIYWSLDLVFFLLLYIFFTSFHSSVSVKWNCKAKIQIIEN